MDRYTIVENGYHKNLRHQLPWIVVDNTNGHVVARFDSFVLAAVFYVAGNFWGTAMIDWTIVP